MKLTHIRSMLWSSALFVALMAFQACGDGGGGHDNGDGEGSRTVHVTLREFTLTPDHSSAPSGSITFRVENAGEMEHEFLVIRTDFASESLPVNDDRSYKENAPGTEVVDEIELIEPGHTESLTLDLPAGRYVLICNMLFVHEGSVEGHYTLGMRAQFTVE